MVIIKNVIPALAYDVEIEIYNHLKECIGDWPMGEYQYDFVLTNR